MFRQQQNGDSYASQSLASDVRSLNRIRMIASRPAKVGGLVSVDS